MIDLHGELVYVGKAKNLRARLLTYFRPRSRDPKAGRIINQARCLVWEPGPDEFAALHRELELIRRWRPRWNVQGQPRTGQHTYVCMGRAPAPYAFLARRPPARALARFGPVAAGHWAAEAVRRLNDWFRLRDCPQAQEMAFAEETNLFVAERVAGCLRHELGTCLGPCAAACSRDAYTAKVSAARAFLAGADQTPLMVLERAMLEASDQQQFERAAVLRDKLAALTWLHGQLERLRQAEAMGTALYPLPGQAGSCRWYLLHAGRAVAALPAPAGAPGDPAALVALAQNRAKAARPADQVAGIILLASWFRQHPQERDRLVQLERAGS
jgi:excinuclease ABC subunit C